MAWNNEYALTCDGREKATKLTTVVATASVEMGVSRLPRRSPPHGHVRPPSGEPDDAPSIDLPRDPLTLCARGLGGVCVFVCVCWGEANPGFSLSHPIPMID